jgi:hypothetical protein
MLVQWACTCIPISLCDEGALKEHNGEIVVEEAMVVAAVDQTLGSGEPKKKRKRVRF